MTIRLVLADDHVMVRTGLRAMLDGESDLEVVGEASDGAEAVRLAGRLQPDVVLMDLRMPEVDGVTATAQIHRRDPGVQVLVVTTYDSDADIFRAVEAGATGYLLKDAGRDEVLKAIRTAATGESVLAPRVASRLMGRMRAPAEEALSSREVEVLGLTRRGLTNREIAQALYISASTVKTHLLHIYSKLGVDNRTAAVTVAIERGILPGDTDGSDRR